MSRYVANPVLLQALQQQAKAAQTKNALIARKRAETRQRNLERLSHEEYQRLLEVERNRKQFEANFKPSYLRNCKPGQGECVGCGLSNIFDRFVCGGWTLCGDCRYWYRHGTHPVKDPGFGVTGPSDVDEIPVPAPHTLNRRRHQYCRTMVGYRVLREILREFDMRFQKPLM